MRLAKCSRGSDQAEKIEQRGNWRRVEFLHGVDQLIAKTRVRKLFAQPMELLHDAIPRHRIVDPAVARPEHLTPEIRRLYKRNMFLLHPDGMSGLDRPRSYPSILSP